jgi:Acetyltransferase (GNAT) domain
MPVSGYLHPGYARSLSEYGTPTELPRSGGWFLRRAIPGYHTFDGMGCYPLMVCQDWSALPADLDELSGDIVSLAAVPDPFGNYTLADLESAFKREPVFFKEHYVADLSRPAGEIISSHHRKYAEKALREVEVEFYSEPLAYLEEWLRLFSFSVRRFNIDGIRAYSRESLHQQLSLPGAFLSIARHRGEAVSAHIWLAHGGAVYAHLAASSPIARGLSADYALYYEEIRYFAGRVHWLDWGGDVGPAKATQGALALFKKGWSTGTRAVYVCGRIFQRGKYEHIVATNGTDASGYFPAYRHSEFS